jgi:hypothetical protein
MWMNEYEIIIAVEQNKNDAVLSKASVFLREFMRQVDLNSDGWPYWNPPAKAADKLMRLVQGYSEATEYQYKLALIPIKSFYTRRGYAAGMKFPEVQ